MEGYQIQSLVESLLVAAGVLGALSIAAWAWVRTRAIKAGRVDGERLVDAVTHMQDQLEAIQEEMTTLHERLDFTERMLTRVAGEGGSRET